MLRDGYLTEGSSTNVSVIKDGVIATPPKSVQLLPGITVDGIAHIAGQHGVRHRRASDRGRRVESGRRNMAQLIRAAKCCRLFRSTVQRWVRANPAPDIGSMHRWFQQAKLEDARELGGAARHAPAGVPRE